jgi:Na+-transporting methylmalonyl-CoA/oxaloacetate decarboxylase gamma subunit
MEWISGMQDVFLFIFLAGLGVWVVAEFFRTFWKPNEEADIAENEVSLQLL